MAARPPSTIDKLADKLSRRRLLYLSGPDLAAILRGELEWNMAPLPDDVELHVAGYSPEHDARILVVFSASFDPVEVGHLLPTFGDGVAQLRPRRS